MFLTKIFMFIISATLFELAFFFIHLKKNRKLTEIRETMSPLQSKDRQHILHQRVAVAYLSL